MGCVEPHPMVGAVIVRDGRVIGMGHHRRFGGPHAEREALADCRGGGGGARGATVYVTLEPCCHHGKTPPCTEAVIEAGISRVIAARPDPNPVSGGGAGVLRRAGIEVEFSDASGCAVRISDPFVKRITTGLPWVIAKWAQFEDGRMVTRPGEPRWISSELCRRRVHRLRGRVDAIVTGIGTVLADDPLLTVRGVKARRQPIRVVLDPSLRTPPTSALVRTAREVRTIIVCGESAAASDAARRLGESGVGLGPTARENPGPRLQSVLRHLAQRASVATVLIEAGPTLLSVCIEAGLIDEAVVHVAPRRGPSLRERVAPVLETDSWRRVRSKRLGDNVE